MLKQERAIDSEIAHLSAGLLDTLALSAPALQPLDPHDSLTAIEVEIKPSSKLSRVRTAWMMAALSALAMVGTLAAQARQTSTRAEAPLYLKPGAPVAMVAPPRAPQLVELATTAKAPAGPASDAASQAPRKEKHAHARRPAPVKAAALPPGPPADFPPVPLTASGASTPSTSLL